jgi:hypothetical protein
MKLPLPAPDVEIPPPLISSLNAIETLNHWSKRLKRKE